jgi:hypothetical protein
MGVGILWPKARDTAVTKVQSSALCGEFVQKTEGSWYKATVIYGYTESLDVRKLARS